MADGAVSGLYILTSTASLSPLPPLEVCSLCSQENKGVGRGATMQPVLRELTLHGSSGLFRNQFKG